MRYYRDKFIACALYTLYQHSDHHKLCIISCCRYAYITVMKVTIYQHSDHHKLCIISCWSAHCRRVLLLLPYPMRVYRRVEGSRDSYMLCQTACKDPARSGRREPLQQPRLVKRETNLLVPTKRNDKSVT